MAKRRGGVRRWSIKAYNRFIKEAKKKGLGKTQAGIAYRQMRGRLKRSVFASDIYDHSTIWRDSYRELSGEREEAKTILDFLEESDVEIPENIETLLHRYEGVSGYSFDLESEGILKISISTTKTRKKFSVKL